MSEMNNILVCMKECIIITAYIEGNIREIIDVRADGSLDGSLIICADAGYEKALAEGIRPDIIMGDFDSMDGALPDDIETFTFPARKDYTDTGLALKYALDNGYERVTVIGGIGGRLDHTIANIQDIVSFSQKGLRIIMRDSRNQLSVLDSGNYMIFPDGQIVSDQFSSFGFSSDELFDVDHEGRTAKAKRDMAANISLFAYSSEAVVSISGVGYPISHHMLTNTYPLGVSNEFTADYATLTIHEGIVLLLLCS